MIKKSYFLIFIPVLSYAQDFMLVNTPCPDGGTLSEFRKYGQVCCKNGYAWGGEKYDKVHGYCGCPDGGIPSEENGIECCKNNLVYVGWKNGYTDVDNMLCGCPDGGMPAFNNKGVCCKNNYGFDPVTMQYSALSACGCPDGGEFKGHSCCKNGYKAQYKEGKVIYNLIYTDDCGCPDGTYVRSTYICCKQDNSGYSISNENRLTFDFRMCGCPDGGEIFYPPVGGIDTTCCKGDYALDEKTMRYSKKWCPSKKWNALSKILKLFS